MLSSVWYFLFYVWTTCISWGFPVCKAKASKNIVKNKAKTSGDMVKDKAKVVTTTMSKTLRTTHGGTIEDLLTTRTIDTSKAFRTTPSGTFKIPPSKPTRPRASWPVSSKLYRQLLASNHNRRLTLAPVVEERLGADANMDWRRNREPRFRSF